MLDDTSLVATLQEQCELAHPQEPDEVQLYLVRDQRGYIVFSTNDTDQFLLACDTMNEIGQPYTWQGADPAMLREGLSPEAPTAPFDPTPDDDSVIEARVEELRTAPDSQAEAIARLERKTGLL